jgi:hypothetical protein
VFPETLLNFKSPNGFYVFGFSLSKDTQNPIAYILESCYNMGYSIEGGEYQRKGME